MGITSILVDQREPQWVQDLPFGNATKEITMLPYGDLLIICEDNTLLAVERKTSDDLLDSIEDHRLWTQLAGIRELTPWSYLVITGALHADTNHKVITHTHPTGWDWASVQGALLKVQEMGVFVILCVSDDDYESTILRLAARDRKSKITLLPIRETIPISPAEQLLLALPGLGPERVTALLEYCGTAAWALHYLTDHHTQKIANIGPKTKQAVRQVLGLRDEEELAVVICENG